MQQIDMFYEIIEFLQLHNQDVVIRKDLNTFGAEVTSKEMSFYGKELDPEQNHPIPELELLLRFDSKTGNLEIEDKTTYNYVGDDFVEPIFEGSVENSSVIYYTLSRMISEYKTKCLVEELEA